MGAGLTALGTLAGIVAASVALAGGSGPWLALAIYSLAGMAAILAATLTNPRTPWPALPAATPRR